MWISIYVHSNTYVIFSDIVQLIFVLSDINIISNLTLAFIDIS